MAGQKLRVGTPVVVPWGRGEVHGEVLEVWGEPARHVRVRLHLGQPSESDESIVEWGEADDDLTVLLSAELVEPRPVV